MDIVVSADIGGMVEFWTGPKGDYQYTKGLEWQYKTDTDWYDFVKVCHVLLFDIMSGFVNDT